MTTPQITLSQNLTVHVNPTRVDDLFRRLADDIINGTLPPGTKLDQQALADRFRVSRTPIREALSQLAATGLAIKIPHKGVIVSTVSPDRLAGMFEVMAELEAHCARLCAKRMSGSERRRLETMHHDSKTQVKAGAPDDYSAMNEAFHAAVYHGAHNDYLEELATSTRARLSPFRRAQFRLLHRMSDSFSEHDAVVQAILRGDEDAAATAMRDHVLTVSTASAEYVSSVFDAK